MLKERTIIGYFVFHFAIILLLSVRHLFIGHIRFYDKSALNEKFRAIDKVYSPLLDNMFAKTYCELSGTNTGYGFFAPNVSSDIITIFVVSSDNGKTDTLLSPKFICNESFLKYSTSLNFYIENISIEETKAKDDYYKTYNNLMTKYLATQILNSDPKFKSIKATIAIYHYPSLKLFNLGKTKPQLITIDSSFIIK